MSGKAIVIALIKMDDGLIETIATLKGAAIAVGERLNAIGVTKISGRDDQPLRRGSKRFVTERVRATALAKDATQREAMLKGTKRAVADKMGTIAGYSGASVISAGDGPDFELESGIYGGSIDFMVSYLEAA